MGPYDRIGMAELTCLAFGGVDMTPLRTALEAQDDPGALMDLSVLDQLSGDVAGGLVRQDHALRQARTFRTNHRRSNQPRLLVLAQPSVIGGNTPVEFLLEGTEFSVITHYANPEADDFTLPSHDLAFCAVPADAEGAYALCDHLRALTVLSPGPVLNLPRGPLPIGRDALGTAVAGVPGMRVPSTIRRCRSHLMRDGIAPMMHPCLIRPTGAHAGKGLALLKTLAELEAYLATQDGDAFFLSEFVDYSSADDGLFRKYRIVFVRGQAFPVHMAILDRWDVWYLNAGMDTSATKRAEEASFMDNFDRFAARHAPAFAALTKALPFDYFGIDCAEDSNGNLLVFEADNALIVHDMDPPDLYPYKSRHMRRIFAAFGAMLRQSLRETVRQRRIGRSDFGRMHAQQQFLR